VSPAAIQLIELLAVEIAEELLHPNENAAESGQEQRRREEDRCEPYLTPARKI